MRTHSRAFALVAAMTVASLTLAVGPGSNAAPGDPVEGPVLQGDQQAEKVVDNRQGVVAPAAPQRTQAAAPGVAARFNDLGTPAVLTGTTEPLATGLPADPVAAATAYVAGQPGRPRADRERRRGPRGGERQPDRRRCGRAVPTAVRRPRRGLRRPPGRRCARRGGLARDLVAGPRCGCAGAGHAERGRSGTDRSSGRRASTPQTRMTTELVAVPTADRCASGVQGHIDRQRGRIPSPSRPSSTLATAASSSGRTSSTTRRTTRSGRSSRARHRSTTRQTTRECAGASLPTRSATRLSGRARLRWPGMSTRRPARRRTPHVATTRSPCTTGTATTPGTVGTETATARPNRDYVYDWTNQWFEETL